MPAACAPPADVSPSCELKMTSPKPGSTIVLRVLAGLLSGEELRFTDHQTCIVGRSTKAQLRLSDSLQFSRFHCRLEINPPELAIIDLGSTNGTKVNGQRIETALLVDGDVVVAGDTTFKVNVIQPSIESSALEAPPTIIKTAVASHDSMTAGMSRGQFPDIPGFSIERELGHGAMGAVFLASRRATGEHVAIKVMRPLIMPNRKVIERFRREASILLRLQHRRIVKCTDFSLTKDDLPYLVMEYIEEIKLKEYLKTLTQPARIRVATGIVVRLLEGLQYAHSMEIVHRDVKPTNLLAFRSGSRLQLKLADFGLAKNYIDAGFSNCSTNNEICGTLAFMSPEQIMNCRYAKPPCDIYAAGVCLYYLISDRLPYEADQTAAQMALILNQPPASITQYVSELPAELAEIISKALSREPSDRHRSAETLRRSLLPYTKRR